MKIKDFHTMLLQWIDNSMHEDPDNSDVDIGFAVHNIIELYNDIESGKEDLMSRSTIKRMLIQKGL